MLTLIVYHRAAIEPQFYAALLNGLELDPNEIPDRDDKRNWPELRHIFEQRFAAKTRDEWDDIFMGADACVVSLRPITSSSFDLRPIVGLSGTPARPIDVNWSGTLAFGKGDEKCLKDWLNWRKDRDYTKNESGAVEQTKRSKAKL